MGALKKLMGIIDTKIKNRKNQTEYIRSYAARNHIPEDVLQEYLLAESALRKSEEEEHTFF